jgi:hypothetical protein
MLSLSGLGTRSSYLCVVTKATIAQSGSAETHLRRLPNAQIRFCPSPTTKEDFCAFLSRVILLAVYLGRREGTGLRKLGAGRTVAGIGCLWRVTTWREFLGRLDLPLTAGLALPIWDANCDMTVS